MSASEELTELAASIGALEGKFVKTDSIYGMFLPSEEDARFKRLIIEAKSAMDDALGKGNDFSHNLVMNATTMRGGMTNGISLAGVRTAREIVEAAATRAAKKALAPAVAQASPTPAAVTSPYVAPSRIAELRALKSQWDMTRLARLCEELNIANEHDCHMSNAMLVRAIVDHIPPVFSCASFSEVANNYGGSKSFRGSMQHLQNSLRNIADGVLHEQIRKTEVLPSPQQVDFRQDLGTLLAEVVRVSK